jgi:hypothetical protein
MEEGEEKENKKIEKSNHCRAGSFPRARPAFLAVLWFAAVRCN